MATIIIGFNNDFESTSLITISIEPPIMEHEHIWVWDHYFSLVLNRLENAEDAQSLLDSMSEWAVGFANKMYAPINELHAEGALKIDKNLRTSSIMGDYSEAYFIEVTAQSNMWPTIHARLPDNANPERLQKSVMALAQHFLTLNTNFFRELPMHILAMRKFYVDEKPFSNEDSIAEAPSFAFNTALKFYQSLEEKIQSRSK